MLKIDNLSHSYGDQPVLHNISLDVNEGEIFCLLGPSGCGKTTLLRVVAGLEQASSGTIHFDGRPLNSLAVHERDIGFMFQDLALFPHMNVYDNVAFGLKMRRLSNTNQRVEDLLELVGLSGYGERDTSQLSGGERQRVALARSLAPSPKLLMLDEPLGALDAALRSQLVLELRRIIKQVGLTSLYVTHDQEEAYAIADRIAIMNAGRIEQIDTPESLFWRPKTVFAARFLGLDNIVRVTQFEHGQAETPIGHFPLDNPARHVLLHPGGISLDAEGQLNGRVIEMVFQGETYQVTLAHESGETLEFNLSARSSTAIKKGDVLRLSIAPDAVIPLAGSAE